MKRIFIALLVLSVIALSACTPPEVQVPPPDTSLNASNDTGPKTIPINMIVKQYSFEPSIINAKVGDTIVLTMKSIDVAHGITIPELGVSQDLPVNEEKTVTFKVDKKGEFPFRCSVFCGSGHRSMTGKIVVE
ncbi:MAG: cupredoxin domain-containing protein [Nanoarchaeota archaeon]